LVYEDNEKMIQEEADEDSKLREMILESKMDYKEGKFKTTDELIHSIYNRKYKS